MVLKSVLLAAAVGCISMSAMASTIALSDNDGDPLAVTIAPGQSFDLNVSLVSDDALVGVTYYLQASASGIFDITGRTLDAGNPFTDLVTTSLPIGLDATSLDLGGMKSDVNTNSPAETYTLATLTLSVDPTAPEGQYTIRSINGETTAEPDYLPILLENSAVYTVTVAVPEPASLGIIGLAGLLLGRRRVA